MNKIIAVDLDDTLCERPVTVETLGIQKYNYCVPITDTVNKINSMYDEGNIIIVYTARGMNTFNGNVNLIYSHLYELTKQQLTQWGIKHHQLVMGKLHYDVLIDDKCMRPTEL